MVEEPSFSVNPGAPPEAVIDVNAQGPGARSNSDREPGNPHAHKHITPPVAAAGGIDGKPTVDHTSLPPELWLEIFRCATYVPRTRSITPCDPFLPERPVDFARGMNSPIQSMRTKCALVCVCRAWRALATELLYEHVVLRSTRRIVAFYEALRETRMKAQEGKAGMSDEMEGLGHGRWVRHFEVQCWARSVRVQKYWQLIVCAVSYCPRLRIFSGVWQEPIPDGFLPVLVQYLPPTLQEIYWQQDSVLIAVKELPLLTTSALSRFTALRTLDLRKICILDGERSLQHVTFGTLTLPNVTHLALPTCPLMLRYATKQDFPALRHLLLDAAGAPRTVYTSLASKELANFLNRHGEKIRTVELLPSHTQSQRPGPLSISSFLAPSACPNLETFVFDCREKVFSVKQDALMQYHPVPPQRSRSEHFSVATDLPGPALVNMAYFHAGSPTLPLLESPHPKLKKIGIRGISISKLYPNKPAHMQAHLEALVVYRAFFPALEVVRTLGFLVDTSTDPYAPDVFIWWTERFEKLGVDLQDGEGVIWMLEELEKEEENLKKSPKVKQEKTKGQGSAQGVRVPAAAVVPGA